VGFRAPGVHFAGGSAVSRGRVGSPAPMRERGGAESPRAAVSPMRLWVGASSVCGLAFQQVCGKVGPCRLSHASIAGAPLRLHITSRPTRTHNSRRRLRRKCCGPVTSNVIWREKACTCEAFRAWLSQLRLIPVRGPSLPVRLSSGGGSSSLGRAGAPAPGPSSDDHFVVADPFSLRFAPTSPQC
jgi:hypothetical protein